MKSLKNKRKANGPPSNILSLNKRGKGIKEKCSSTEKEKDKKSEKRRKMARERSDFH